MKVLSFGCGVQTVTLAAMACLGDIEMPDFAVFADTGWEKRATMEYFGWFKTWAQDRGLSIILASKGNIRSDALNPEKRFASMPLWTETGFLVHKGKEKGALRRQCTNEYKIEVVDRAIRQRASIAKGKRWKGPPAEEWLGISLDEVERMNPSRDAWKVIRWPLIERKMRRGDCIRYLESHDLPIPPKSACIGCPFTDNARWREMKVTSPNEFEDACQFDEAIRKSRVAVRNPVYLHPTLKPLREANLEEQQADLFMNECAGRCGV